MRHGMTSHQEPAQQRRVPVWKKNRTRINFRSLVVRHDRLLTFVGAFIVFATFMVREEIGEHFKEAVDSWKSAQAIYASGQAMMFSANASNGLVEATQDINERVQPLTKGLGSSEARDNEIMIAVLKELTSGVPFVLRGMTIADYQLSLLLPLTERLPDAKAKKAEIEQLRKKVELMKGPFREVSQLSAKDFDDKTKQPQVKKVEDAFLNIYPDVVDLGKDLPKVLRDVVDGVESKRKRAEQLYQTSKTASVVLFVFGWGLGLAGKLYGLGGSAAE